MKPSRPYHVTTLNTDLALELIRETLEQRTGQRYCGARFDTFGDSIRVQVMREEEHAPNNVHDAIPKSTN